MSDPTTPTDFSSVGQGVTFSDTEPAPPAPDFRNVGGGVTFSTTEPTPPAPDFRNVGGGVRFSTTEPAPAAADFRNVGGGVRFSTTEPAQPAPDFRNVGGGVTFSTTEPADLVAPNALRLSTSDFLRIPHELRGYTPEELAQPGSFQNPRTGRRSTVGSEQITGSGPGALLDAPILGAQQMYAGVAQMAQPNTQEKLRGAGKILIGGTQIATPAMLGLGAGVDALIQGAAWYSLSKSADAAAHGLALRFGANPEDAAEIGQVGGAIPLLAGTIHLGVKALADSHAAIEADAARRWQDLGDRLEPARNLAGPAGDSIPVTLKGPNGPRAAQIDLGGLGPDGRRYFTVSDATTGQPIMLPSTGTALTDFLNQYVLDRTWLQRWNQAAGDEAAGTQILGPKQAQLAHTQQILEGSQPTAPVSGYSIDPATGELKANRPTPEDYKAALEATRPKATQKPTVPGESMAEPAEAEPAEAEPAESAAVETSTPEAVETSTPEAEPNEAAESTAKAKRTIVAEDKELGQAAFIAKHADGKWFAGLLDTESGETLPAGMIFDKQADAIAYAQDLIKKGSGKPKAEAPAAAVDDEEKPTETLSYRNKGNHKIDIYLHDDAGWWSFKSDYNLQGLMGGTNSSFGTLPNREAAIAQAVAGMRRHLAQAAEGRGSSNGKQILEAGRMLKWLDSLAKPKPKASPQSDAKPKPKASPQSDAKPKPVAAEQKVTYLRDDFGNWSVPTGSMLISESGRALAPAPKFDASTNKKRKLSLTRQRAWLVSEAQKEAGAKGDDYMKRTFDSMQPNNFSRSDADTVNDYLFGDTDGPTDKNFASPTTTGVSDPEPAPETIEADAVQKPAGSDDSEALGGQLPAGSGRPEDGGPVSAVSGKRSRPRKPRNGAGKSEGPQLDAGAGTSDAGVGIPSELESVIDGLPPRAATTSSKRFEHDYRIPAERSVSGSPEKRAARNIEAIKVLRQLEKENRAATVEEQDILAQYVGWGAVPQLFAGNTPEWRTTQQELRDLLSPEEYEHAQRSTTNAHYTGDEVVRSMWDALLHLGAKPGMSYLEPAVGVGNFFGLQPAELLEGARRVGVDKDTLTGKIAQKLYPDSGIDIKGFEEAEYPTDYFDAVISNVPFGNFGVHDASFRGKPYLTSSIHNYFFAKALDSVRPGGIISFITSRFTMDGYDKPIAQFREYMQSKADLLGAVRLPTNAFMSSSGTHVITDIIFLRKRLPEAAAAGEAWAKTNRKHMQGQHGYGSHDVNEYYGNHPENILGTEGLKRGQFSATDYNVEGTLSGDQLTEALKKALPADAFQQWQRAGKSKKVAIREIDAPAEQSKLGALFFDSKGNLFRKTSKGSAEPMDFPKPTLARIKGQLSIRNVLNVLMELERNPSSTDAVLKNQRQHLNTFYDKYVKEFGPLSSRSNQAAIFGDPDAPLLSTLERNGAKAPIFTRRVFTADKTITSAANAKDALYVALNQTGTIAWDRMAELTGRPEAEMQKELEDEGIVYVDPKSKTWQTAEEYLSGSVRSKLREAQQFAKVEPQFKRNVEALEKVLPDDIPPGEISAALGVTWVPAEVYGQFAQSVLNASQPLRVNHIGNEWILGDPWGVRGASKWSTSRVSAHDILKDSLNMRRIKVYDPDGDGGRILNKTETLTAQAKQRELQEHFNHWLFSEPKRSVEMARIYNDLNNDLRLRTYDGAHLSLPEMSRDAAVLRTGDLDPHQKAAIWRMISQPNVLIAHDMGTGKTYEMIAAGMELKRLGLIKRPMYVVPNATLTGWQLQFNALYPSKRVLVFSEKDLEKKRRQQVMAQIATGDWDAVVVPESSFGFLRVGDDIFQQHYDKLAAELEGQVDAAKEAGLDTRIIKRMEKMKERLLTGLQDKRNAERQDNTVSWEQLGIDQLFVDEAHNFKKLGFTSKQQNVAGIDQNGNQKTFDLRMKMAWTQQHGRGVVFATGTPVTNTMGELFNLMKYLIEPELEARGLSKFDDWSANFGRTVDVFEPKPEGGGYQMKARFSQFVNLPEMAQLFRSFADVVTGDMVNIPRPDLKGGGRQAINLQLSEAQTEYLQELRARAEGIRRDPRGALPDNMLAVYGDAGKMTLDMRLVDPHAQDEPGNRLNRAADEIYRIWDESKDKRSTQLVFSDLGIPSDGSGKNAGFSVYEELTRKLIARGIPANEIAYVHQAKNKAQRTKLLADTNAGVVRVLMGSSGKLGVGVNVQQKVLAMHHLDIPHRPSDLEQREKRGIRQGNENPEVSIFYYITKGSLDESKFANVLRKAKFINQVLQGKSTVRTAEDVGGMIPSMAMFAAMASGDPRVLRKIEVDAELDRLGAVYSGWRNEQYKNQRELDHVGARLAVLNHRGKMLRQDIATRDKTGRVWKIFGQKIEGEGVRDKAAAALAKLKLGDFNTQNPSHIGSAYGLELSGIRRHFNSYNEQTKLYDRKEIIALRLGDDQFTTYESASPLGLVQKIENAIKGLDDSLANNESSIQQVEKDAEQYKEAIANPKWPHQEQYNSLVDEQKKLVSELSSDKGDDSAAAFDENEEIKDASVKAEAPETEPDEEDEDEENPAAPVPQPKTAKDLELEALEDQMRKELGLPPKNTNAADALPPINTHLSDEEKVLQLFKDRKPLTVSQVHWAFSRGEQGLTPGSGQRGLESLVKQGRLTKAGLSYRLTNPNEVIVTLGSGLGALQPYIDKFLKNDVIPTAKQVAELLKVAKDDIARQLAPASRGADAKVTALTVRKNAAQMARSREVTRAVLEIAKKFFDRQTEAHNFEFIDRMEAGQPQSSADLQKIADVMRYILDSRRTEIQNLGTGKLQTWIDDYFPHLWKHPARAAKLFQTGRPLEGSKAFLKKRSIDTFAQGIALGLEPVSDNPVALVLAKAEEMDKYIFAHRIVNDLKSWGLARFKRATAKMPDGYAKLNDRVATIWGTPTHKGALQIEGELIAPERVATVVNNYLSPGLRDRSGAFRAYLGLANVLNQAQLGLSAFHAGFTTVDVAVSKMALGFYQVGHGDVMKGLASIAKTPLAPVTNLMRGHQMMKEYFAPGSQGALYSELVDAMVQAGGRAKQDDFYETQVTAKMLEAWRQGNVLGAILRLPWSMVEQTAKPIMQWLVPRQKLGVFADLAQYELEKLGTHATDPDVHAALARAWDSVDNRLGQLVYDNLFWHKTAKDLAMASVRSVGWNVGTIREVAGGLGDLGGAGKDLALRAMGRGNRQAELTPRASYVLALPVLVGLIGAIAYYLRHGHGPKTLRDYFVIDGYLLPSYIKDAYEWGTDPLRTAGGKIHPLLATILEMLANKDFYEHPIRHKHDALVKQAEQEAQFLAKQFVPLAYRTNPKHHASMEEKALSFIGIKKAPKSMLGPQQQ